MTAPAPAPSEIFLLFDKNFTTAVNFVQNVVYVFMLLRFLELGMFYICFAATTVSPVESWKGLFYNMWFGWIVLCMLLRFKDTLECLILFENAKRRQESRKDATTIITMNENGAQLKHVDNGSNSTAWHTIAGFILQQFLNKDETKENDTTKDASAQNEEEAKEAPTPSSTTTAEAEDEIKQDAASASSSARSSADTSDVLN
jgi:hypothetical protein